MKKINTAFILSLILASLFYINSISIASENINIPKFPSSVQERVSPEIQTGAGAGVDKGVSKESKPGLIEGLFKSSEADRFDQKENFLISSLKFMGILIIILISLVFLSFLYKLIKNRPSGEKPEQAEQSPPEEIFGEPATVSEAVSSFVRHKLRK